MTMKQIQTDKLTNVERVLVSSVRAALCGKLRGKNLQLALDVFRGGIENANDTVFLESAQPRTEWASLFICSMEGLLSGHNVLRAEHAKVLEAFALIDIRP